MPTPHYLHVYQRPKQGNAFLKRYPAAQYRHRIVAIGGFDTASCEIVVTQTEAESILENYIGCRVAFYADNPCEPIWEGLISTAELQAGGVTMRRSLDNMLNAAVVTYTAGTAATGPTQTAVANDLDSQAIYGIKAGSIEGTQQLGTDIANQMAALRDLFKVYHGWPQTSTTPSPGGTVNIVRLEMIGIYHTLEWQTYVNTSTTDRTIANQIINVFSGLHNGTTFFDSADSSQISTANTTFDKSDRSQWGKTVWQFLQDIQEPGDGSQRYIMGITPTNFNTGERYFYYRAANTTVEYTARVRDGMRLRNAYGGLLRPWTARPDRGIRINDVLVGWNAQGDDPRETYIDAVNYDAEGQTVDWQGVDDYTAEGTFQLARYYKRHNVRFGAQPRTAFS